MAFSMGEEKALKSGFKSATFAWNWLKTRFPEEYREVLELEVKGEQTVRLKWPEEETE